MAAIEHEQARYLLSQFVLPNDIGLHPFIHHRRSTSNNGMNAHHIIHAICPLKSIDLIILIKKFQA
jgi:hypothetical protein